MISYPPPEIGQGFQDCWFKKIIMSPEKLLRPYAVERSKFRKVKEGRETTVGKVSSWKVYS